MTGLRRIGVTMVAGSALFSLAACSRTSDGTIVANNMPMEMPGLNLAPKTPEFVPGWMRKQPEPDTYDANFPPPPEAENHRSRTKVRPPVVKSGSGKIACENKAVEGRVKMVCK